MITVGRPSLGLGTFGTIRVYDLGGGRYKARTLFRDFDGVTRPVARTAGSRNAAKQALKDHLRDRIVEAGVEEDITAASRVESLAEAWWSEFVKTNDSPGTLRLYRGRLDNQIIPSLGKLRVRELTTGVLSRHVTTVGERHGAAIAKATRTVLSNMFAYACQRDAMKTNPIRDIAPVRPKVRKLPKALTVPELQQMRALFTYDPVAVRRDIPMLSSILLATGLRIGECLAIVEDALDPVDGSLEVRGTVVWVKGKGLFVKPPKSAAGLRKLILPAWAVDLLTARFDATRRISQPVPLLNGGHDDSPWPSRPRPVSCATPPTSKTGGVRPSPTLATLGSSHTPCARPSPPKWTGPAEPPARSPTNLGTPRSASSTPPILAARPATPAPQRHWSNWRSENRPAGSPSRARLTDHDLRA